VSHEFAGKVVLVTGGSNGIGRAAAVAYGERGAKVYVADMDQLEVEKTVQFVKDCGGYALFVKTDVSQEAQVKTLIDTIIINDGHLDHAFNNAGIEGKMAFTVAIRPRSQLLQSFTAVHYPPKSLLYSIVFAQNSQKLHSFRPESLLD
jgi:NAD(P)-dependent dehydrogenase (short-subunit alcohol dehydrogenase family)